MSGPALVLNPNVPAVDPANGTTISLGSDGKLQLSVGGGPANDVGGGSADPGARVTAPADQANLTFGSLNGAAAGGYRIFFEWIAGTGGDTNLILQLNGVVTNYSTAGTYTAGSANSNTANPGLGTGIATTTGFDVVRAGGGSGRDHAMGVITLWPSTGGNTLVIIQGCTFGSSNDGAFETFDLRGIFPAATINQAVLLTLNGSSTGMKQNSYGVIQKLGLTA